MASRGHSGFQDTGANHVYDIACQNDLRARTGSAHLYSTSPISCNVPTSNQNYFLSCRSPFLKDTSKPNPILYLPLSLFPPSSLHAPPSPVILCDTRTQMKANLLFMSLQYRNNLLFPHLWCLCMSIYMCVVRIWIQAAARVKTQ